ncbi:hypothetical protein KHQ84_gp089 [Rhodococcus phage Finch]|uniref:Uncharacterized protein n=1 Tax=Rhodococcus phage Finch TaxID=2094144 RepID=A0A2P1JXE7_9CAUD|nr:hypothetical protein KHQ84_gp089 [Rhodococcus phage Finch]AVO25021.1 hypothetical protein SEA_FINCH_89 [Rhodococcus phage Finch]
MTIYENREPQLRDENKEVKLDGFIRCFVSMANPGDSDDYYVMLANIKATDVAAFTEQPDNAMPGTFATTHVVLNNGAQFHVHQAYRTFALALAHELDVPAKAEW